MKHRTSMLLLTRAFGSPTSTRPTPSAHQRGPQLMTGKVPQRVGITDWIHPSSGVVLPKSEVTIAEVFQQQGYQTAYVGKWHLGEDDENLPTKHGFEWIKGVNRGGSPGSYYFPFKRSNGASTILNVPDFEDGRDSDYLTDVLTTKAIDFPQIPNERTSILHVPWTLFDSYTHPTASCIAREVS